MDERHVALLKLARRALSGAAADALADEAVEALRELEPPSRARAIAAVFAQAGIGGGGVSEDDAFVSELAALIAAARAQRAAARAAAERYREMLERASEGIYIIDASGRYVDVNASGAEMLGFTKEELCQRHIHELVDPADPPIDLPAVRAGRSILRRRHIRRKDGGFIVAELGSHMLPDGMIFGIARDVTERQRAERELRETAQRFRHALGAARAGAWEWVVASDRTVWSEETYVLFGLDPDGDRMSSEDWLRVIHPDDRDAAREVVARSVDARADIDFEYRVVRPDGTVRWMRSVGRAVVDDEALAAIYGIVVDVTETKEAELARAAAEARLQKAHRMEAIGRLAGGIAHDFNNLLTVILAATEVVSDDASVRGAVAEHLEAVRQAATRGAALTRQLLVLSRHNPPDSKLLDVSAQIRRTVPIMRRLLGEDIEIRVELTDGLRPVRIDPSQLDQILLNLAINARDAMPRGGRLVFATSAGEGDRSMELTVTDDGTGMSAETRERAFEPFFTTKPEGSGTGLGLATVYGIVKQRGGEIAIESAPDRGTRFRITLPTAEPRDAEDEPVARQERPAPAGALVLVVEDEPSVRRIVRRILESAGHRVLEAGSGAEALELAHRAERPLDALVTDVVMPGMSGPELTKRLRAEQPGLAVLLMSGYLGDVLAQHGVGSDVALLEKPFAPSILLDALGRALAQSPRSASTSSS